MAWIDPEARVPYVLREHRALPDLPIDSTTLAEREARAEENARRERERVTWLLRPLTVREYARVQDAIRVVEKDGATSVRTGTMVEQYLRGGLAGWSGGGAPAFAADKAGRPTDDSIARIPGAWRMELADAIDDLNTLGPSAVKA
jgi:hypothetical protein